MSYPRSGAIVPASAFTRISWDLASLHPPHAGLSSLCDGSASSPVVFGERSLSEARRRCLEQCIDCCELLVEHPRPTCKCTVIEPIGAPVPGRVKDLARKLGPVFQPSFNYDIDIRLDKRMPLVR